MAIVVTVKIRPRFVVSGNVNEPTIYDRIACRRHALLPHQHGYKLVDWIHTADYLSDRVASYPVPASLLYMRSEHNEDRRQKATARGTRGRPARRAR